MSIFWMIKGEKKSDLDRITIVSFLKFTFDENGIE